MKNPGTQITTNIALIDSSFSNYITRYPDDATSEAAKLYPPAAAATGFLARFTPSTLTNDDWVKIKVINDDRVTESLWTDFFTNDRLPEPFVDPDTPEKTNALT